MDVSQFKLYPGEGEVKGSGGLSRGAIAAIALGCTAAVVLVGLFLGRFVPQRNAAAI